VVRRFWIFWSWAGNLFGTIVSSRFRNSLLAIALAVCALGAWLWHARGDRKLSFQTVVEVEMIRRSRAPAPPGGAALNTDGLRGHGKDPCLLPPTPPWNE
jgi:hypothetical protein